MKYFSVNKETLSGMMTTGEVYSDGDYVNLPDDIEAREITMGFSVTEYEENGAITNVKFYPVATDMESFEDDSELVLEKIKGDYPAPDWQNNQW